MTKDILSAEQEKFEEEFIGEYDIVNDGQNEPYITGVMDKSLYSVDGLMDKARAFLRSSNARIRLQTLQEVMGMIEGELELSCIDDRLLGKTDEYLEGYNTSTSRWREKRDTIDTNLSALIEQK